MAVYNATVSAVHMPDRIKRLPVSPKGFPVPWFVAWINGEPDFRVIAPGKFSEAWKRKRCWVCGDCLGVNLAMTVGPMCAVNRTISEPPSHRECAIFACRACPFLSNPRTKRREMEFEVIDAPGKAIMRNPGAVAVWITRDVRPFRAQGGTLFRFGEPSEVLWFAGGRAATRDEVETSILTGLPILMAEAEKEGAKSVDDLVMAVAKAQQYLPRHVESPVKVNS